MEFIRRNGGNPEKTMVLWKKMLYNFLKVSDSKYVEIFFMFKEILERMDIRFCLAQIEKENGIKFPTNLKDYICFSFNRNLECINEMLQKRGIER